MEGGLGLGGEGDLCVGVDAASRVYTLKTSVCGSVCVCVCVYVDGCGWVGVGGWVCTESFNVQNDLGEPPKL